MKGKTNNTKAGLILGLIVISLFFIGNDVFAQANWWDKYGEPQYGGTITVRASQLSSASYDPNIFIITKWQFWFDWLFSYDWTVDRSDWGFNGMYTPVDYYTGKVAESWEYKDPMTVVVKIKKNVFWQKKPPVNGRQLTAKDIEYNYDRILGTGSGFKYPDPSRVWQYDLIKRVVATDEFTVEFQLKQPSMFAMDQVVAGASLVAPEWVALGGPPSSEPPPEPIKGGPPKGGDKKGGPPKGGPPPMASSPLQDWKNAVGSGPWLLTDVVHGSKITLSRNPDYWDVDPRRPQNKVPYADKLAFVNIDDMTTTIAALRTGKIDIVNDQNTLSWQQQKTLSESNPEIQFSWWPSGGPNIPVRIDHKPFDDIRVRKALQMAIDRESIASAYYNGTVKGIPAGIINPALEGWCTPYKDWPTDLREEYSYDPEAARALLAEAGYPNGFKTTCVTSNVWDNACLEIIKSQFKEIGVNMNIELMDMAQWHPYVMEKKHDQMVFARDTGFTMSPRATLQFYTTGHRSNFCIADDAHYNEMYDKLSKTTKIDDAKAIAREMDMYYLKNHWTINLFPMTNPWGAWQPWIKEFNGESTAAGDPTYSYLWIDQGLKKSMGY